MKKMDEMHTSIQLQAYKWAITIGWIVAVIFFIIGAIAGVLHLELAFIPFVQTGVYWIVRLLKTEKMTEGTEDLDDEE